MFVVLVMMFSWPLVPTL